MGVVQSKLVKKLKDENVKPKQTTPYAFSSPSRKISETMCSITQSILDWKTAEKLFFEDSDLVKARLIEGGETALHLASVEGHSIFVANLLEKVEESDLEIQNGKGSTALSCAAAAGHVNIAKLLVDKNKKLPKIHGNESVRPLYVAVLLGRNDMGIYLLPLSAFALWTTKDQIALLTTAIESGLYALATCIIDQNKKLAVVEDSNGEIPLEVLARNPSAFCGSKQQGSWANIANTILSYIKLKPQRLSEEFDAYTLLGCLWNHAMRQEDAENQQVAGNSTSKLLFAAAESGNDEFLVELIRRYPDFVYKVNHKKNSIFHIAILHRYVQAFNLIHELSGVKDLTASCVDSDGNNLLHLAAKLAPKT